tara:strand:- start:163 stop:687 length:525 start_codon:yes stop_codon:yes gene_type:complete
MAGSLIEISSNTLGSDTSSVTLTGIDSTFDVYKFTLNNVIPDTADADLQFRFTESGSPNTTSNYDNANKLLRSDTTFSNLSATNNDKVGLTGSMENDGNTGGQNGILYIFNANNSSEFTFATLENVFLAEDGTMLGNQGGFVLTQTTTVDGGQFFFDSGNIRSGARFVLYGLRK